MLRRLLALLWLLLLPVLPADAAMDYAKQVLIGADFSNRDLGASPSTSPTCAKPIYRVLISVPPACLAPSFKTPTSRAAICGKPRSIRRFQRH